MNFAERRKFARLITQGDVEYSVIGSESLRKESISQAKNISAGGICVNVDEKIEKGAILSLRINLPGHPVPISLKGKVIWSAGFSVSSGEKHGWDVGIEFIEISEVDRQKIFKYVFDNLRKDKGKGISSEKG